MNIIKHGKKDRSLWVHFKCPSCGCEWEEYFLNVRPEKYYEEVKRKKIWHKGFIRRCPECEDEHIWEMPE